MSEMQVGGALMSLAFCFLLFPSVFLLLPSASLLLFTTRGWMLVTGATGSG
jgi:Tfp pilus assembly pilus retraction ATPase PilT